MSVRANPPCACNSRVPINAINNMGCPRRGPPAEGTSTTSGSRDVDAVPAAGGIECPCLVCGRVFTTRTGLGVHCRRAHPQVSNALAAPPRVKVRWSEEELAVMAREEVRLAASGVRFINQELLKVIAERTLEGIKGARRKAEYREMVDRFGAEAAAPTPPVAGSAWPADAITLDEESPSDHLISSDEAEPVEASQDAESRALDNAIQALCGRIRWSEEDGNLKELALRSIGGTDVSEPLNAWLKRRLSVGTSGMNHGQPAHSRTTQAIPNGNEQVPNIRGRLRRRRARRSEFAKLQRLWKINRRRAAREVIDGADPPIEHSLEELAGYWGPIVGTPSTDGATLDARPQPSNRQRLRNMRSEAPLVWGPISVEEVEASSGPRDSAPGPDGVSHRTWAAVSAAKRALVYNVILRTGSIPSEWKRSRTTFLPKRVGGERSVADYRPITIGSVGLRQLHRILAIRLNQEVMLDERQRGFIAADGCCENIAVLDALLWESRQSLREIHVAVLDFAKAFDTVSHEAVIECARKKGLSPRFISYLAERYNEAEMVFEVNGSRSERYPVRRGVRQGDPLSPVVFNLIMEEVLAAVPREVGFRLVGEHVSALAFADDLTLVTSSIAGMRKALHEVEKAARALGLEINPTKSAVLSMVPDRKRRKHHYVEGRIFRLKTKWLKQLGSTERFRYLGVDYEASGVRTVEIELDESLRRIGVAPLKPQQKLIVLRTFLVPRYQHALVLGNISGGRLREIDVLIRRHVRKWLRLPKDSPDAHLHASACDGGLGVPSLVTAVPNLIARRLERLATSSFGAARAAYRSTRVEKKLRWALKMQGELNISEVQHSDSTEIGKRYWRERLYASVDGRELSEASKCVASSRWVSSGADGIPGRDFVQYVHVHINALPSRVRNSRGRRDHMPVCCRAGCESSETTAHIIQQCWRTHGGRIRRHDAVTEYVAKALERKKWTVVREPHVNTNVGLRKPDLVCSRQGRVVVLDTQVVTGARPLDRSHREKVGKYMNTPDFVEQVRRRFAAGEADSVEGTSCTISWRGIWSKMSAESLREMGIKVDVLSAIATRVLCGSHTNWTRFNAMTGRRFGRQ